MPCDSGQHARAELLAVMKGEDEIRPAFSTEGPMRAGLTLDLPTESEQGTQNPVGLRSRPPAHAAAIAMWSGWGFASPCSSCSARTLKARISTRAMASSGEEP